MSTSLLALIISIAVAAVLLVGGAIFAICGALSRKNKGSRRKNGKL